jgi:hypothetical protein
MNQAVQSQQTPITSTANQALIPGVIDALQKRTGWKALRETLKREKLPLGQGWKDLATNAAESTQNGERLRRFIATYFAESIVAGERYVQIYHPSEDQLSDLIASAKMSVSANSDFTRCYPSCSSAFSWLSKA